MVEVVIFFTFRKHTINRIVMVEVVVIFFTVREHTINRIGMVELVVGWFWLWLLLFFLQ